MDDFCYPNVWVVAYKNVAIRQMRNLCNPVIKTTQGQKNTGKHLKIYEKICLNTFGTSLAV